MDLLAIEMAAGTLLFCLIGVIASWIAVSRNKRQVEAAVDEISYMIEDSLAPETAEYIEHVAKTTSEIMRGLGITTDNEPPPPDQIEGELTGIGADGEMIFSEDK